MMLEALKLILILAASVDIAQLTIPSLEKLCQCLCLGKGLIVSMPTKLEILNKMQRML